MRRPGQAPDESVWGKARGLDPALPPYPLVRHLLDASAMTLHLWDHFLSENQRRCIAAGMGLEHDVPHARGIVALCAGLHDIGKLSGFQFCDARAGGAVSPQLAQDTGKIGLEALSHDVAGMESLPTVLDELGFGDTSPGQSVKRRIAEIVGGHHGRFFRFDEVMAYNQAFQELFGGAAWAQQRAAHADAVSAILGDPPLPTQFKAPSAVLVTGVVILADWLVSQENYLKHRQRNLEATLEKHFATSCIDAARLAQEAGLLPVELDRKDFAEAYGIKGSPNPLQQSIMEELPAVVRQAGRGAGILLVTAAPGDGKSETALEAERILSAACGTRGFAFVLPTMATSDQMHSRIAGVLTRQNGETAGLTLVHSMAWLSNAYADDDLTAGPRVLVCDGEETAGEDLTARHIAQMRPGRWLRGSKRPLLAQYAVGTIDQSLMAVLPVRHNALRMLALSGKTFIVDEAHAYDPYMQVLLGRLLNWLGAYGVPVVLLSATLPASVSDRLIKEYLIGAGHGRSKLKSRSFKAPYPGWLYVDAATGDCNTISDERHRAQAAVRPMDLTVDVQRVSGTRASGWGQARLAAIEAELAPLVAGEGCALVVCNTVPEAQETYDWIRERFTAQGLAADELQLLHARFPGDTHEELTAQITARMGRSGPRPNRRIIVATQVVEQSLDLDADVVISDLAPLALLLQRAGRCWRHETWWAVNGRPGGRDRPNWALENGPRLVVLDPLAEGGAVPREWGEIYPELLLKETSEVLAQRVSREACQIAIPAEVQELVEAVHGDHPERFHWSNPAMSAAWTAHQGNTAAQRSAGTVVVIPPARTVQHLNSLHHLEGTEDEWEAATRLGADSVRLLCLYDHADGRLTLDAAGTIPLPEPRDDGQLATADVRAVMKRTIPVRSDWFHHDREEHRPPAKWAEHPVLADLLVLKQPVRDGQAQAVLVDRKQMRLDEELGLIRN
ncbi:CRISPR-associated endonuclease Cas3'' [Streptomyces sp. NPDC058301]|uniref:CRISPR-associated endonuclease Cas3'' n=1 Tax=Streptomyces sp. NPDC058301 TaxID=3346436 RepID=UPI0036E7CB80